MESYLLAAGCLSIALGIIHSVMGEILIFQRMREGRIIPTNGHPILKERHVRILWASWHLVTVFGWGLGVILLRYSLPSTEHTIQSFVDNTILITMLSGAFLVFIGTKGKHPGWVVLLAIAILLAVK